MDDQIETTSQVNVIPLPLIFAEDFLRRISMSDDRSYILTGVAIFYQYLNENGEMGAIMDFGFDPAMTSSEPTFEEVANLIPGPRLINQMVTKFGSLEDENE